MPEAQIVDTLIDEALRLADEIAASPHFADSEFDINIVRALLYLQRTDPRIDARVRQYLNGRPLTDLAHAAVAALDPNTGDGRAFEIIEALGKLMWAVDKAALVFTIDQVEDLRFFSDAEERFQTAVRDLIQIANRLPTSIVIISCLEDFYSQVRAVLAQSYIDRIEKAGPVLLLEGRSADEARAIIGKRLEQAAKRQGGLSFPNASAFFSPQFFEEFSGLSTRRLLEHAQQRIRAQESATEPEEKEEDGGGFFDWGRSLAAALGFASDAEPEPDAAGAEIDYRGMWERFASDSEAEIPSDDHDLIDILAAALNLAKSEWGSTITMKVDRCELADDLPALDIALRHKSGYASELRVFAGVEPEEEQTQRLGA